MQGHNKQGNEQAQADYQKKFEKVKPEPSIIKNIMWAFLVGGLICSLGQFFLNVFMDRGLSAKEAAGPTAAVMVFLGAFFTGLGVYDDLGQRAGAGSIVPITGFANSIVSPAMEFKREGYVFGIGAKMFVIAGPVLVYGLFTAFIMGLVYWFRKWG